MFGDISAHMQTFGDAVDEGLYSEPVPAHVGEDWTFSVWLQGGVGHEAIAVEIWEYGADGESLQHAVAPFVLSEEPQRYYVRTRIAKSDTTEIRALVRTWDFPQAWTSSSTSRRSPSPTRRLRRLGRRVHGRLSRRSHRGACAGPRLRSLVQLHLERGRLPPRGRPPQQLHLDPRRRRRLALATLLLLFGTFVWDAIRRARASISFERALVLWAIGTWFVFMVNALTGPVLTDRRSSSTVWVVMLLPALVSARRRSESFTSLRRSFACLHRHGCELRPWHRWNAGPRRRPLPRTRRGRPRGRGHRPEAP